MGWDENSSGFTRGEWVIVDYGIKTFNHQWGELTHPEDVDRRRRRLPGTTSLETLKERAFLEESQYKGKAPSKASSTVEVHRDVRVELTTGRQMGGGDGTYVETIDLKGKQEYHAFPEKLRKITLGSPTHVEIMKSPELRQLQQLMKSDPNVKLPDLLNVKPGTRPGEAVTYDGEPYKVIKAYGDSVEITDGKTRIRAFYYDSKLKGGWNNHSSRPLPIDNTTASGFVTISGYNAGDFVWIKQDEENYNMGVIALQGINHETNEVRVCDATTGNVTAVHENQLRPMRLILA